MRNLLIAAAIFVSLPALAQPAAPAGGVLIVPAKDIKAKLDAAPAKPGAAVTAPITTTGSYITLAAHRTADGTPEQHAHWTDVMMMLQGEITLTYGGTCRAIRWTPMAKAMAARSQAAPPWCCMPAIMCRFRRASRT